MKKSTKTTCFLSALILCLGLCGCNSDEKSSSKVESVVETTEQETTEAVTEEPTNTPTEKNIELDKLCFFKDISFLAPSAWEENIGDSGAVYLWLDDKSVLGLQAHDLDIIENSEEAETEQFSLFYIALCNNYETVEEPIYSIKGNLTYMETNCTNDINSVTNVRCFIHNDCLYSMMSTYSINGKKTQMSTFIDDIFSSIDF